MNAIVIFKTLTKNWLRSPTGVFFSILFPLMLLLIFGTVFGGEESTKYSLYVQNHDVHGGNATNLSRAFIKALESTNSFEISELDKDVNVSDFIKHQSGIASYRFLVIPDGFEEHALNRSITVRNGIILDTLIYIIDNYGAYMNQSELENITMGKDALSAWMNQTNTTKSPEILLIADENAQSTQIVKGIVYSVVNAFNSKLIGASDTITFKSENLQQRQWKAADYYLPGYIASFIMTNGIVGITTTITEFRRNGIVKRLSATPLKKRDWILGCILQQTFLGFTLTVIMVGVGWVIFGVRAIPDIYAICLIITGCVTFSSIGMTISGFVKDVEAAAGIGNAIAYPLMFLSGAFWPLDLMPAYLQSVAKFSPVYHFHDALREIMIYQHPENAITGFAVLALLAVVFTCAAIKLTKWKDL